MCTYNAEKLMFVVDKHIRNGIGDKIYSVYSDRW